MGTNSEGRFVQLLMARASLALLLAGPAAGQVTSLMSVDTGGAQGNKDSFDPWISLDGRYVAFTSYNDLDSASAFSTTFSHSDVYLRDRQTGVTERLSVDSSEVPADSFSYNPSLSSDIRYVAFLSFATNLVSGDTNGPYPNGLDVFVRDRQLGTTERVSVDSSGAQANGENYAPSISADGRYVVFYSYARNLVPGDTNGSADAFLHDRQTGTTERVSVDSLEAQGNGDSLAPLLSLDGRFVAFYSSATNLVAADTNGTSDVFVRDLQNGTTERVSVDSSGVQGNGGCFAGSLSADGRYVAFPSFASNLVAGDTNGTRDVFLRDRQNGTTVRVSVGASGTEGNGDSFVPWISSDGRFVAFQSTASNLVVADTNGVTDVFVHDRQSGTTERVSVDSSGSQGIGDSGIFGPSISADGRYVAFDSHAKFDERDGVSASDVYVRDREYSAMGSLCAPGTAGVISCPCANPPAGLGRGCDNSSATGGAILSASGIAYLSQDTLVFTTSGERPTALSLLLQGDAVAASGIVYGQGVSCATGTFTRLFSKSAVAGSITAPDFGAGDPTIPARSAAKGDVIQAGQSRWYLVAYRDPVVLGSCPATSTFNATQTGLATWLP